MSSPARPVALAAALLAGWAASSPAQAAALTPWYGRLDDGSAALMPQVLVDADGGLDQTITVQGSFEGHFDMLVGLGGTLAPAPDAAFSGVTVMPRIFLNDHLGAAAHATIDPSTGTATIGPAVHAVVERGWFTMAINVGYRSRAATAGLAPELGLGARASVFLELNPTVDLDTGTQLVLVPGLGLQLDRGGHHDLALGVQVPTLAPDPIGAGLRYIGRFGGE